ncbi:MAG: ATP-binding protein, partial [Acidobacteriota bacterium]
MQPKSTSNPYETDWERFVRRIHDNENVQINLTGSSSRLMSKEIASSLRGRTMTHEISPLNFNEYLRFKNISRDYHSSKGKAHIIHAINSYLNTGGFPEVLDCSETFRLKILQDYFNLILYKDLIERYKIRNHSLLKYLLKFLLSNNANPFSVNKFYRDSKSQGYVSSKDSLHNYLSYLEDAFCFSFVPIFSDSLRKQQVNYKKVYAVDHGLVTGMVSSSSYNTGRLLETMVYNQLRRHYSKEEIFYYRTFQKKEIDFIVYKLGNIQALIQVSETITKPETRKRETESLYQALKELNIKEAKIITGNEEKFLKEDSYTIQ